MKTAIRIIVIVFVLCAVYAIVRYHVFKGVEWRTGFTQPEAVIDTIASIAPRPLFLIAAGEPEAMEPRIVQFYYDHAQEPKTIWMIPEAGHGGGPEARPEEYAERLVSFFDEALLSGNWVSE